MSNDDLRKWWFEANGTGTGACNQCNEPHIYAWHTARLEGLSELIEAHTQKRVREARIDEIEIADSKNVPAGGLHRPSYYAIDPDYAEKRIATLSNKGTPNAQS